MGCTSSRISGKYIYSFQNIASQEFSFDNNPDKFEYFARTEGQVTRYSLGSWYQQKKRIYLKGLDSNNLNVLDIENKIERYQNEECNKIAIKYKPEWMLDTIIRVEVLLNYNIAIRILNDTTFCINSSIDTIKVKTYLYYRSFIFRGKTSVDTLYSKALIINYDQTPKLISLNIDVKFDDFFRIPLTDTLVIKNSRRLMRGKAIYKKIRN